MSCYFEIMFPFLLRRLKMSFGAGNPGGKYMDTFIPHSHTNDFLTGLYTQRRRSVLKRGGFIFHPALRIPLLKFSKMPFALFVGTSKPFAIFTVSSVSVID